MLSFFSYSLHLLWTLFHFLRLNSLILSFFFFWLYWPFLFYFFLYRRFDLLLVLFRTLSFFRCSDLFYCLDLFCFFDLFLFFDLFPLFWPLFTFRSFLLSTRFYSFSVASILWTQKDQNFYLLTALLAVPLSYSCKDCDDAYDPYTLSLQSAPPYTTEPSLSLLKILQILSVLPDLPKIHLQAASVLAQISPNRLLVLHVLPTIFLKKNQN